MFDQKLFELQCKIVMVEIWKFAIVKQKKNTSKKFLTVQFLVTEAHWCNITKSSHSTVNWLFDDQTENVLEIFHKKRPLIEAFWELIFGYFLFHLNLFQRACSYQRG